MERWKTKIKKKSNNHLQRFLKILVQDYGWIHLLIGVCGNGLFFVGSILFLPQFEPYKTLGVWLFIIGSCFMLVGAIGQFLVSFWKEN